MSKKQAQQTSTKQSVKEVFHNNLFILKLIFAASPAYFLLMALDAVRGQLSIFFEHTVGIGYVLQAAEFNYPFRKVAVFILLLAGFITLGMVFTVFVGDYLGAKEKPKIRQKLKMMLYEKAKDLDLACYDDPEFYNEQVLAISEVDNQIERAFQLVQNFLTGLTVFITAGIFFLIKDKMSILFSLLSFVLSFVFTQMYNKRAFRERVESLPHTRKRDYVKRIFYLSDYAKEIRLNPGVSDILFHRFEEANDEVYSIQKKYGISKFFLGFMRRYVSNNFISDVVFISYLVYQSAVKGSLSFSTVAILYASFGNLKRGLQVFTDTYPFASESSLYVNRIRKFLGYETKIVSAEGLIPEQKAKEIELRHVGFSYGDKAEMLLKDLNLKIRPGEKIAVVGYNGAGKTTFVKLLMRLYDVKSGEILADGTDIRKYDVKQYRNTIGTVFQDFKIFAGNIRENVILDVEENGDAERIDEALKDSGLSDRIKKLEKGTDTQLTTEFAQDGVNLSGGESQKLAIARVFYKKAGLMILDEPSSALDPIAEYQLNHAMLKATKDNTVIFISHRLSTTRLADRIIMLENGQIAEQGTHEELLALNGKYAQMWKVQAGAYIAV